MVGLFARWPKATSVCTSATFAVLVAGVAVRLFKPDLPYAWIAAAAASSLIVVGMCSELFVRLARRTEAWPSHAAALLCLLVIYAIYGVVVRYFVGLAVSPEEYVLGVSIKPLEVTLLAALYTAPLAIPLTFLGMWLLRAGVRAEPSAWPRSNSA